jgi:enoyl-CoA hydratase/carnithine racemase
MDDVILYEVKEKIAWITINQAEKMNRLTTEAMIKLVEAVELAGDDDGVKVIVITGAGEKAFCAGASIEQFEQDSILSSKKNLDAFARICRVFNIVHKPSIAMINGYAMAGGCGLAMLPTFSIASENAVFGCPEIKIGVWPMMVMAILFRTVGRKRALELICTGETIDAREAEKIGMVTRVVPHEDLETHVVKLAESLKGKSGSTLSIGLEAFSNTTDMEYGKALSYLRDMAVILVNTPDAKEGTRAFMEKREAKWNS